MEISRLLGSAGFIMATAVPTGILAGTLNEVSLLQERRHKAPDLPIGDAFLEIARPGRLKAFAYRKCQHCQRNFPPMPAPECII